MPRWRPSASLPFLTDHYYQLVNWNADAYPYAYKPPTATTAANARARLLDFEHMRDTAWQLFRKGQVAEQQFGTELRMSETGSSAGRGADNVSNSMAGAIWTMHYLFTVACPYDPPSGTASNRTCDTRSQYSGVNFHNSEDNELDGPGNASYNLITDDGRALPGYYADNVLRCLRAGNARLATHLGTACGRGVPSQQWDRHQRIHHQQEPHRYGQIHRHHPDAFTRQVDQTVE